jgi:hypothetical protein
MGVSRRVQVWPEFLPRSVFEVRASPNDEVARARTLLCKSLAASSQRCALAVCVNSSPRTCARCVPPVGCPQNARSRASVKPQSSSCTRVCGPRSSPLRSRHGHTAARLATSEPSCRRAPWPTWMAHASCREAGHWVRKPGLQRDAHAARDRAAEAGGGAARAAAQRDVGRVGRAAGTSAPAAVLTSGNSH